MTEFKVMYYGNQSDLLGKEVVEAADYETALAKVEYKLKANFIDLTVRRGAIDTHELIITDKITKILVGEGESLKLPVIPY